jgi:hypothetical protein
MTLYIPISSAAIAPNKGASSHTVSGDDLVPRLLKHVRPETTNTLGTQQQADLTLALLEACSQASEDDWDAYGGRGVLLGSYVVTERLLRSFPDRLPLPEISVHPDGELALDWIVGRRQMFSVSVAENGTLSFAGLFGKNDKVTGKVTFSGVFPPSLLPYIERLDEPLSEPSERND